MSSYYVFIVLGTSFTMLAMAVGVHNNILLDLGRARYFQILCTMIAVVNMAEMIATALLAYQKLSGLFYITKFIELSCSPIIPILAILAVCSKRHIKLGFVIIGANLILQIISLFTGFVFSLKSGFTYTRGPLYGLYLAFLLSAILFLFYECYSLCKKFQINNLLFLAMLFLLTVAAFILPLTSFQVKLDWTFVAMAVMLLYMFYNHLIAQSDCLTKLLNRKGYEKAISMLQRPAIFVLLDINNFKSINDSYGHLYGDVCLKKTGMSIKKAFGKYGKCYRIGGDEFFILIHDTKAPIVKLITKFHGQTKQIQSQDSHFPTCAIGYAFYNPKTEKISDAIGRADQSMYQNKSINKQTYQVS